ncbi:MAG: four helix bundle protein [Verrucomicrobiales bacterium]
MKRYDLEERLLDFSARVVKMCESMPGSVAGRHVSGQVLRSGTAPLAHHGEAQGAESRKDFIHKLGLGLKELRETHRWLRLIHRVPLIQPPTLVESLIEENEELIRIFVASLGTARSNGSKVDEEPPIAYAATKRKTAPDDEK